jgi:hypothetical protein
MQTQVFWQRPDLTFPTPLDTILFDLDGTLIKTIDSFHAADIAAAEYIAGQIHRLDWGQSQGASLLTHAGQIWLNGVLRNGPRSPTKPICMDAAAQPGCAMSCLPALYLIMS